MGNVLEVLPFGNEIDLITVKGSTLLKALERSVSNYDPVEQDGAFLQFSGKVIFVCIGNIGLTLVILVKQQMLVSIIFMKM